MAPLWECPWGEQPRFGDRPWRCEPEEAHPYLNFPLLLPTEGGLPDDLALSELSVRPEGPEQWSSARLRYSGPGRELRLKQYHLDWWRPTELAYGLRRTHGLYRAGDHVVAWGRDRRGRAAACLAVGRTTVELAILRGTFVELELRHLLASLQPADPAALATCAAPPFPRLAYHVRRGKGPRGLDELAAARWSESLTEAHASAPTPLLLPDPLPAGWRFDAAACWPSPPPSQSQWLLADESGQVVLYARARPSGDSQPLRLPATYRPDEGWRARQTMQRRRRTTYATQHPDLGGWSAAWAENGFRYQLFVRAGALPGNAAFTALLARLAPWQPR